MAILCCLWLAAAAWAQDDAEGPLAEARSLALSGRHAGAIPLYERLVAETEQREGRGAWSLVLLAYELAVQHHSLGAVDEAEVLYRRSLVIAERHRGTRDLALVPSLRGLATVAASLDRLDEAESLYRRALEIQEADGGSQTGTARTLAELGLICQLQERAADAERYYRRVLEIADGSDLEDIEIAVVSANLGALYDHQERFAEAETLFRRVLEIRGRLMGQDHPELARVHEKLASLQYRQRRFAESATSYERSLRIREQAGQEDLAVAKVLGRLAVSYHQLGRSVAAESHVGMARAILDAQCGGRERAGPCLDAIKIHRDLSDELLAPPAEPAPPAATVTIASSPPAAPIAAPASPPPAAAAPASPPPVAPPPVAPLSDPPPPSAAAVGGRVHRAQVGARADPGEAAELLAQLRDSHPRLLGDLTARVVTADLGERGVWHRIQVGEFRRLAEAKELCAEIVRRGHEGCWVVTTED